MYVEVVAGKCSDNPDKIAHTIRKASMKQRGGGYIVTQWGIQSHV